MNCEHVQKVLDAYLDRELDASTHAELAQHLLGCPACAALQARRETLATALRRLPRFEPPAQLRRTIGDAIAAAESVSRTAAEPAAAREAGRVDVGAADSRPRVWPWRWPSVALAASSAALAFMLGVWVASPVRLPDPREPVIARHVASLRGAQNLIQVASSDRHAIKPWFSGRVDFAPTVRDLQSSGFALIGARLDRVASRDTAAIVYRIREHDINLFVWRIATPSAEPVVASALHGYSIVTWAAEGLGFAAVSDVDSHDLQRFAELVRAPAR
jgi:anti-sigma factor RsiW